MAKSAGITGAGFRAILCLVLFAFTLQSFITQTHIHGIFGSSHAPAVQKTLVGEPSHHGTPSQDSTTDCPFCQAITDSGAFFLPVAPSPILPVTEAGIAARIFLGKVGGVTSHPWQSRAPPQD